MKSVEITFPEHFYVDPDTVMARGYLDGVRVMFADGRSYEVSFIDPGRLSQDLEELTKLGTPYLAEPCMIVVNDVTDENMRLAVQRAAEDGFSKRLLPVGVAL